ncbi:NADP-dependent phosphogluconate dehydrogenase [Streptomyces sp. 205]|uniref:6-phosphogluconate dehydrogenase, decarboxylating n=1 Tax=Streptomyces coffeae TaxID=621382 RepID=A0ABS1NSI7_9ACTN|nr:NADP-dependent phosphogluconate dehydrogenase [Streptomyces coffeae]MBL1102716.1 NADP-dependent phosphogluconate dehydrogenase [Streptomyces coffeae]
MRPTEQVGVMGLGAMGHNLARQLARSGYTVVVHNRTAETARSIVRKYGGEGRFLIADTPRRLVAALKPPRRVLIVVEAGSPTDAVISEMATLLAPGDLIVDGGNSHFEDTRRREAMLRARGVHFIGAGMCGGTEDALHGLSITADGSDDAYNTLGSLLHDLAARTPNSMPTVARLRGSGAGHFVKTVHNGLQYADMQLIAEAYGLLRRVANQAPARIAHTFREWNQSRLAAHLMEITSEILGHTDTATGQAFIDVVADRAEQKDTGRWTVQTALELGVPVPGIAVAVFARTLSCHRELHIPCDREPGPLLSVPDPDAFVSCIEHALYASKVTVYAQGWQLLRAAATAHGWDIDPAAVASVWRSGSILRAPFLDRISAAYLKAPDLPGLLHHTQFNRELDEAQHDWRTVVATAARNGLPVPALATALSYYDALRTSRSPAALIQAQRDFFGTHGYRRTDREGTFSTLWAEDRSEQSVQDVRH